MEYGVRRSRHGEWIALCLVAVILLLAASPLHAASFSGNACVHAQDPSGGQSWRNSVNVLTVSCGLKVSDPSTVTLTTTMTILAPGRDGTEHYLSA